MCVDTGQAKVLLANEKVNTHAFFLANATAVGDFRGVMPPGRVHAVLDLRELPGIFKTLFQAALTSNL